MANLICTYYFNNIAGNYLIAKNAAGITNADGCKISNGQITRYVTESELLTPIEITLEYSSAYINVEQFYGVLCLQKVVLDDSSWTISSKAFELSGLENIELGTGVYSIGENAFKQSKLKYITSRATTPPQIVANSFNSITTGGTLYYPAGSNYSTWLSTSPYYLGYYDWNGSEIVEEPTYPDGEITAPYDTINISSNGDTLYYIIKTNNIQNLERVYTDADFITVRMITEEVFPETTFEIKIEKNETTEKRSGSVWFIYKDWNDNTISHKLAITQDAKYVEPVDPTYNGGRIFITYKPKLLDGVYKVGLYNEFGSPKFSRALYNGTELTESDLSSLGYLTVPDANDVVIEYQFDNGVIPENALKWSQCIKLEFGSGIISVGFNAFASCSSLLEIILPDYEVNWELPNSSDVYGNTFASCSSLINVVFPENVYDYSYGMFDFCTNLVSIDGTKIKEIKNYMFSNCTSLKTFVVSDTSEGIGANAFSNCTSLSSISIGSGVTHIDGFAFSNCTSLEEITLPSKITTIMAYAFGDCTSLKTIYAENTTKLWLPYLPVFTNVVTGGTLYYPAGADYSTWLSNQEGTLGYYGWNGVEIEPEPIPDGEIVTPNQTMTIVTSGKTFQYTIETTNINYLIAYYISFNGNKYLDTIDGFISMDMVDMNNFNIIVQENEGDERRCSIYFQYMDYNGKQLTHILSIVQDAKPEEEPDEPTYIEPEIRLYKTRLDYASDGGDKYVQIDYYGATTILEPTCTQSWVTIKKTQGGWYEEDGVRVDQHQYRITMQPTNFARNINVVFSCTDVNGAVFKDSHLMLYQSAPAEPSYVILSNNNITLDGEGDTKDVSVTYTNMGEIIMPEVPEGYEIEEVERTDSDNITQVKYRIKKVSKNQGNFILNFTGKDTEGNTVTSEDLNVEGKGQSTTPAEVTYYSYNTENDVMIFDYTGGTAEIKFNIEGYTKPFDFHVSVNDDNYNVHLMTNELDYDDGVDYAVWKMVFESEGNDSSSAYEGNVVVTYTDANTEKIFTIPFHVRYANEGKLTLGSEEFRYDKDGELLTNYNTISVGYLNIQTKYQPTCSTWVTLGTPTQRGGTFYGIDEMWDYPISVQANEGAERTGFVRFTGLGKDGKEYAIEAVVKQEGNNTVIKVDEGYIELQSLSVALPASGGSETFQVKYYDAVTIYPPEFQDNWATITKVSETSEDGFAWNGEACVVTTVTYKVTAQPTTSGRQAKVLLKLDSNYYDGGTIYFEKDKFIVYQLAEGSTEIQGSLHVLRSSLEYTYYGSPIGWNPEVGYTDLAPSTPIISESWCRIKSYTDKTSKEYDLIRAYDLELDTNESTFSRTCNITFIGEAEDGTDVRKTITITQKGQEEIINDGEYSNYKGYFRSYDNILYSVSFITNPRSDTYGDIRLAGDSPVVVSYSESDRLFTPLRTSTCTVKVVSEHYLMNLYTGKAHGTQVILRNEDADSVEWCGFLQPNLYNQGFTECMEEIEFEASDCLSTLQYFEYKEHYSNGRFTVTFKDIIDDIMVKCGILESYYLTQKPFSDGFQSRNANFQYFYIPEENFFSEEGEPWKYKEVLEEICKYLGVVCFQWKDDLYFIDYDRYQTNKTMVGLRWDKSDDWQTMNSVTLSNPNQIVGESYKETGADISLDDVFNKVSVNCNYYNFEDIIPDLFDDDKLVNRFENNGYISIGRWTANHNSELETMDYYRIYDHQNINSRYYEPLSGTGLHEREITPTDSILEDKYFFRKYVGGNIVDMVHLNYSEANGKVGEAKDWERYLMISQLNRPWCGAEGTFHWENYNFPIMEFKNLPVIFIDNTADEDTDTPIRVTRASSSSTPHNRTPKPKPVPNYLVIKAEAIFSGVLNKEFFEGLAEGLGKKSSQSWYTYGGSSVDHIRNTPALCFYLELPQAGWWNGKEWVDYKTHFEVPLEYFGENKDDNKYYEHLYGVSKSEVNNIETNLFLGTTGYKIPLPKTMTTTQEMYFAIAMPKRFVHCSDSYGGDYTGEVGNAYCFIKELEMKICNRNSIFFKNEDMIYENIIDEGNVIEGEEIDLKITSDNYEGFSFSHVSTVTAEEKNTTDISFYNKEMKLVKAEEGIIERYVNQYSTPSIKENVTLDMSFTPTQLITDTYWDKDFVIIGQEIDYKYDRQRLTLLEKK